jgi:predicted metal-dependent phosphoesterase TrpH
VIAGGDDRNAASPTAGRRVDLHAHSTASDGAASPTSLVEQARVATLAAVALTDHDTVAGVAEALVAGTRLGVGVVVGVELSAVEQDGEVHILGLHLLDTRSLEPVLADFRQARVRRADTMVHALCALGVPLTLDAVLAQAGTGAVGRPHVARALIASGWARDQRDAFDRYLGAGRPAFVAKQRLSVVDAIRLIHEAGGVAVLAHPGRDGIRARLEPMRAAGLDGVEVRHPSHSAEDEARLGALADALDLVPSGGSDWHGAMDGPRVLGAVNVPWEWSERQIARAHIYRPTGDATWNSATASPL